MDRTNIIRGPAIVTFDSQVFYTEGDITLDPGISTFNINTSMFGNSDERFDDIVSTLSFTPAGVWTAAQLAVLFPYTNPTIGSSVFGATDKNVVIQTLAGQQITWKAGAITQMPGIILSANKIPLGEVQLTCIGTKDTAWTDSAKRAAVSALAFADTSFDPSNIPTVPYTAAWGGTSPWDSFETEAGWNIEFNLNLEPVVVDTDGTIDMTVGEVGVMARCVPVGISETQLLTLLKIQGTGIQRGASLGGNANDLVIQGAAVGDPKVTVKNASPKTAGFRFGTSTLRVGEVGWVAVVSFTSGARNALFEVGTVPTP